MAKRLIFVDFIRGMMIFYMVILHAFLYRVVHQYKPLFEDIMTTAPLIARIIAAPFIFFGLWGSFFGFLTGIVFFYRAKQDIQNYSMMQKRKYFMLRGLSGLLLIVLQYIWLTLFSPESTEHPGPTTHSLLTGTIENLRFSSLEILHYSTTSMLESIGWFLIVFSILGFFIFRLEENIGKRFFIIMVITLVSTILLSILLEFWIGDPDQFFTLLYENGKLMRLIFLIKLSSNRFSFFPLIVFALCGAIIGFKVDDAMRDKRKERYLLMILGIVGSLCVIGYIVGLILGFDMMSGYTSSYVPLLLQLLNLGGQLLYIMIFYIIFRKYQSQERDRDVGIVRFLHMYSTASLTVYFLEPFTSAILFQIVQNLYWVKPIAGEFFVWFPFLILNALVWFGILILWRKYENKFSVEWNLKMLRKALSNVEKKRN